MTCVYIRAPQGQNRSRDRHINLLCIHFQDSHCLHSYLWFTERLRRLVHGPYTIGDELGKIDNSHYRHAYHAEAYESMQIV